MNSVQRNYKTIYDVPQRPNADIRFGDKVAEAGPKVDECEPFVDLLLSDGFKEAMRLVILPYIKDLRAALLRKTTMDETERARFIGSIYTIEHIVTQIFKRAGEEVPAWLQAQFK